MSITLQMGAYLPVAGFLALTYSDMRNQAFYGILLSSSLVAALLFTNLDPASHL